MFHAFLKRAWNTWETLKCAFDAFFMRFETLKCVLDSCVSRFYSEAVIMQAGSLHIWMVELRRGVFSKRMRFYFICFYGIILPHVRCHCALTWLNKFWTVPLSHVLWCKMSWVYGPICSLAGFSPMVPTWRTTWIPRDLSEFWIENLRNSREFCEFRLVGGTCPCNQVSFQGYGSSCETVTSWHDHVLV